MIGPISAMNVVLSGLQSLGDLAASAPSTQLIPDATATSDVASPTFSQALRSALGQVDDAIATANANTKAFSAGDQSIPLSDVMVSLEQANLSLQLASGVRDKFVAAYTSVMNMQV